VQPDIRAGGAGDLAGGGAGSGNQGASGDTVKKGQLLLRVQSNDVSGAYQTYRKAENDERLARIQFDGRRRFTTRALSRRARWNRPKTGNRMPKRIWMRRPSNCGFWYRQGHPSGIVDIKAPISGVITDQQVTNASGVQGLGSPIRSRFRSFVCLDHVRRLRKRSGRGASGRVRRHSIDCLSQQIFRGRIDNILPVLDATLAHGQGFAGSREIPGMMRVGMFVSDFLR